jgi:NADH:ubiquinone oxidoreductase subunit F (NADH-binding)/(2Fe-2S) ferredoxin/NAD-dependent dihydropyrimidine dehydrogenase PreA subunit
MALSIMDNYRRLVAEAESRLRSKGEVDKIRIQVGSATCEDAAGAKEVWEEFRKHIAASGRDDILLRRTACTGRCSCEPIVGVIVPGKLPIKYERVNRDLVHKIFTSHIIGGEPLIEHMLDRPKETLSKYELLICEGPRCSKFMNGAYLDLFINKMQKLKIGSDLASVYSARCFGLCSPMGSGEYAFLMINPDRVIYRFGSEKDMDEILEEHIQKGNIVERLKVEELSLSQRFFNLYGDVAFFNRQSRIALRNSGIIDPENMDEYIQYNGFESLAKVLEKNDPAWVIQEISDSRLRGRGGGGFPTGLKWSFTAKQTENTKYLICNADEGDPGAFMDRSILEGDPFSVIEGMIIGGFAIGANKGFIYIRAEYPMSIKRLEIAIEKLRQSGLLGNNILGSAFSFDIEIRLGAGAFVCGEETALIHSIEGQRGEPRIRPPYPAESGLWGKPTVINNVETFANVPVIINYGADWFRRIGTEKSGGTKVFALAGKVKHTGLVEVPMGTTLREIIFDIGGGVARGKRLKAVQTGGPAGGFIPAEAVDTIVDFDTLTQAGSIMGSGGMIVVDEDDCMVDLAKFYMTFSQDESCGKCTPCREGTKRMLEILERITKGEGTLEDLDRLERLGKLTQKASLCGLGRNCANPVLSSLKHFRDEYLAHVLEKHCPARRCHSLIRYEIDPEKCVGCSACAKICPVMCISGELRKTFVIDQNRCIRCGRCYNTCRFDAIIKK